MSLSTVGANANTMTLFYPGSGRGAVRLAECVCALY
jgi:hypothetical protein